MIIQRIALNDTTYVDTCVPLMLLPVSRRAAPRAPTHKIAPAVADLLRLHFGREHDLEMTDLSSKGATALAHALESNSSLVRLK